MRKIWLIFLLVAMAIWSSVTCFAEELYPAVLDNGNLVLVDAHMGTGEYTDRSLVEVERYAPPNYQIAILL